MRNWESRIAGVSDYIKDLVKRAERTHQAQVGEPGALQTGFLSCTYHAFLGTGLEAHTTPLAPARAESGPGPLAGLASI